MAKKDSMLNDPSVQKAIDEIKQMQNPTLDDYRQAVEAAFVGINRDMAMDGPPAQSLQVILGRKSLKELKRYARYHSLKNLGGIAKDALAVRLLETLCDARRLEDEISCMAKEEWIFFTSMLSVGTIDLEMVPKNMIPRLVDGGYIHIFHDEGKIVFLLPDEVRASYDTLDKENLREYKRRQNVFDEYARAAVNLYGVISLKDFASLVNGYLTGGKTSFVNERPYETYLEGYDGRDDEDYFAWKEYLVSGELIKDDGEVSAKGIQCLLEDRKGKPRYKPSAEVFLKYADPDYYENTPQVLALRQALLNFDVEEKTVNRVIDTLHDVIAGEFEHNEMFHVLERNGVVLTFEQLKTALPLMTDMSNHTRIWSNYGHTPNEIFLRRGGGAPRNHVMSDTAGNTFPSNAERFSFGSIKPAALTPAAPQENIPRNGPCPCGSGKKYKHCCGSKA